MTDRRAAGMLAAMRGSGRWFPVLVAAGALAASACSSGTETGNPSLTGALSYTGYSSTSEYGVRTPGSKATLERAWFDLDVVSLAATEGCAASPAPSVSVPALGVGDHAAGNHNVTSFESEPGRFCSVTVPFVRVPESAASAPEALRGHSLLLEGTLADGTPFTVLSDATPVVRLAAEQGGFAFDRDRSSTLLAFDFGAWLGALELDTAERENGSIIVSSEHNSDRLVAFEQQLASGVALFPDADANGQLDEGAAPLARAE